MTTGNKSQRTSCSFMIAFITRGTGQRRVISARMIAKLDEKMRRVTR
jgi:hypothetical protein